VNQGSVREGRDIRWVLHPRLVKSTRCSIVMWIHALDCEYNEKKWDASSLHERNNDDSAWPPRTDQQDDGWCMGALNVVGGVPVADDWVVGSGRDWKGWVKNVTGSSQNSRSRQNLYSNIREAKNFLRQMKTGCCESIEGRSRYTIGMTGIGGHSVSDCPCSHEQLGNQMLWGDMQYVCRQWHW